LNYPNLRAVGMDIDEVALAQARERLAPFQDRVTLKRGNFSELKQILGDEGYQPSTPYYLISGLLVPTGRRKRLQL